MGTLRVALAQINPTVGDFEGNVERILNEVSRARAAKAALVVFPELSVCGYPPEDLLLRRSFLRDSRRAVERVAAACEDIAAVVGFADPVGERVRNAAAIIRNGKIENVYHKMELPNYGVFDEKRYFSPGSVCGVFQVEGVPVAVTVCEDIWVEQGAAEECASSLPSPVVVNISASPFHAGKLAEREEVLTGFAARTGSTVCYVNLVGGQDELVFDGGSLVVNARGELLARAPRFDEAMIVVDIDPEEGTLRGELPPPQPEPGRVEEIYRALVLGTGDYVRKNRFERVVVGLSGGIDSALTAAVAVDALGSDRVRGVTMPSRFTSQETLSDAERLAENLDIPLLRVPLERIFKVYMEELQEPLGPGTPGVAAENIQARIRGNILMALSNRFGCLVLTTGNKSEMAVGYCTLYGDMAGGFAVIKDVPKTVVYELARHVNEESGREVIPESTLTRAPTAELRENQKDEDSLPPYDLLDPVLRAYVEEDKGPDEISVPGCDRETVADVLRMVDRSEYKRRQAPPGVKITPKAFGRDRRLPITNRYQAARPGEAPKETL
jgi:NAD+ synthase (glutamine-hydrolysing)